MKTFDQTEIKFYMIITHRGVRSDIELLLLNFDFFLFFVFCFCFNGHTIVYKILLLSMTSFYMYKRTTDTRPILIYKFQCIKIILCRYFQSFVISKCFGLNQ